METVPAISISNPDAITYSTEELKFTILGGVRLEGLDRLRVTLRTEIVHRKFPNYMNNPELAALPMHQSLDLQRQPGGEADPQDR
jgi:hypothetical protein